jgi:hypothetical protein
MGISSYLSAEILSRGFDVYQKTVYTVTITMQIENEKARSKRWLPKRSIWRRHTRLRLEAKGYIIEDLGSTNGTFVNGNRLSGPQLLHPGDTVHLGDAVTLIFQTTMLDPNATIVSPVKQQATVTPVSPPPAPVAATPTPAKAGKVLASTAQPAAEEEKPSRPWLWASIGCLGIIICLAAIGAVAFDTMNLYCTPPFDSLLSILYSCP